MVEEDLITLAQACRLAPFRPSVNCVWRWCRRGVRSRCGAIVKLRHVRMGGRLFTTKRWIDEFGAELAAADAAHFGRAQGESTDLDVRRRNVAAIDMQLRREGI